VKTALMQRLFAGMASSAVALLCCAGCHDGTTSLPDGQAGVDVGLSLPDSRASVDVAPGSDTPEDRLGVELGGGYILTFQDVRELSPDASGQSGSCYGTCLELVFSQCLTTGQTCTSTASGSQTITCYSSGVKTLEIQNGSDVKVTVKKANGDPCYQADSPSTASEIISDPDGNVISDIQFLSRTQLFITCQDGSTTNVDLTLAACTAETNSTCSMGACSW
jgi:hypothetical protein